ncbi:glycosyltransferase family 2 protein [Lachnospiraceae bacterium ZAX-1]
MEKKVSIIVPCYNSEKFLDDCFTSIQRQTIGFDQIELIFINDASTDGTLDKLLAYEKKFPQSLIVINSMRNIKQGGARNLGLEYATGPYIMFVDSDDWIKPQLCETLYRIAQEYDTDIIQYPFIQYVSETQQNMTESVQYGFLDTEDVNVKRGLLVGIYMEFCTQNKFYKHSFVKECGAKFPENVVYEEPFFLYPLFIAAKKLYCTSQGMYYYRQTTQSVSARYVSEPGKLYDRPKVQLELLKKLVKDKKTINLFYNEIEYYFLTSYYVETLYFSGSYHLYLGIDYFEEMQKRVLELFPEYEENVYLNLNKSGKAKEILKSVHKKFDQQGLMDYCEAIAKLVDAASQ